MTLHDAVQYFTEETGILACMSAVCGTATSAYVSYGGFADEDAGILLQENSVFDLASLTKLFTAILALRLGEEGALDFKAPVTRYAAQFQYLDKVSVDSVFGFKVGLQTAERVDLQPDRAAALQCLWHEKPVDPGNGRAYSDMHAMTLKYVIEGASGKPYFKLLHELILDPLVMRNTWCLVPREERYRCVSCDREHRIEGEHWYIRSNVSPGTPHDPKARALALETDDCAGHAGLFSTAEDMTILCQALLDGRLLSRKSLLWMAENRTGRKLPGGGWTQFLGGQCYVKHPDQYYSEIPVYMTNQAIGLSGFTGNHLSIDPSLGIFTFYLGSRVQNRLSVLIPPQGKWIEDFGLEPDGPGIIRWKDGTMIHSSVNYVHRKDAYYHPAVQDTLGI